MDLGEHISGAIIGLAAQCLKSPGFAKLGKVKEQQGSCLLPGSFRARGHLYEGDT